MKTFLENLRKELKMRHFSNEDIEEILADHKEMIESAKEEGLSEDDLHAKFGDPEQLADDLLSSKPATIHKGGVPVEGYNLFKTFPVMEKEFDVDIRLVSEDVTYLVHDLDQIEVHEKRLKEEEDYTVTFDGKTFELHRNKGKGRFSGKSPNFVVKVPQGCLNPSFELSIVSGDAKLEGVHSKELTINATSGDVSLRDYEGETAKLRTVSGDFKLLKGTLGTLNINMVSGDCVFEDSVVSGDLTINTVSGDFEVKRSEAGAVNFKSVSGDLEGKEFYPKSVQLRSVSGDIEIKNSDSARVIEVGSKKSLSGKIKIK